MTFARLTAARWVDVDRRDPLRLISLWPWKAWLIWRSRSVGSETDSDLALEEGRGMANKMPVHLRNVKHFDNVEKLVKLLTLTQNWRGFADSP